VTYQAKLFFSTLYDKTPYNCQFHTSQQAANEKTKPFDSFYRLWKYTKYQTIAIVINYSFFVAPPVHQWVLGSFPKIYFKVTFWDENDFSETILEIVLIYVIDSYYEIQNCTG